MKHMLQWTMFFVTVIFLIIKNTHVISSYDFTHCYVYMIMHEYGDFMKIINILFSLANFHNDKAPALQ